MCVCVCVFVYLFVGVYVCVVMRSCVTYSHKADLLSRKYLMKGKRTKK